jgi:hypothetical protein
MIKHDNLPQKTTKLDDVYPAYYFYYDKIEGIGPYFMICGYYLKTTSGFTTRKAVLDIVNSKIYDIGDGENYKFNGRELVFRYDSIEFDIDNVDRNNNYSATWDSYTVGNMLFVDGYLYFTAVHTFDNTDTKFIVSTQVGGTGGYIYVLKESMPEPTPTPSDDGTNELITDGSGTDTTTNDEPTSDPEHNPADYDKNYKVATSIYQYTNGKIILTR